MTQKMQLNDFARIDHGRAERCGFPEFIYGAGKTAEQIREIVARLLDAGENALATRVDAEKAQLLCAAFPAAVYDECARTFLLRADQRALRGDVAVICAGTSDLFVAREALVTLEACQVAGRLIADVGVAGLHRLLSEIDSLRQAQAIIAVAGMEGALPSVVGGLVACPVIAVPTSVGYGTANGGHTALMAMLNSCASGVTVVNIDNGFGAACAAVRMLHAGSRTSG